MKFDDAAEQILAEAGEPLHYREITDRALVQRLIHTSGKTPWETLNARIAVLIKKEGEGCRFYRHKPGVFGLRKWGLEPEMPAPTDTRSIYLTPWAGLRPLLAALDKVPTARVDALLTRISSLKGTRDQSVDWSQPDEWIEERLEGAERDLAMKVWKRTQGRVNPRYLRQDLTLLARHGLLDDLGGTWRLTDRGRSFRDEPDGPVERELDDREGLSRVLALVAEHGPARSAELLVPWMRWCERHTNIASDNTGRAALSSRLRHLEAGMRVRRNGANWEVTAEGLRRLNQDPVAVAPDEEDADPAAALDILELVQQQKERVRDQIRAHLHEMDPYAFEHLVKRLLEEMGYDGVEVTQASNDKGVDVVGRIEVGITSVQEVIQVKRLKGNVHRTVLDALRGSLHRWKAQRGTIITTGGFSKGTREAAFEPGVAPITLIDGDKLVELLIEHDIGVRVQAVKVWKFDPSAFTSPAPDEPEEPDPIPLSAPVRARVLEEGLV